MGATKKGYDKESCIRALGLDRRTPEESYAINAAGGKAAGEAKRRRKAMREVARAMLDTELCANDELRQDMEDRGFRDYTEAAAILFGQINRARAGDTEAAKFLRDTSGQRPADQIALGSFEDLPFEAINLSELSDEDLLRLVEQRGGLSALSE